MDLSSLGKKFRPTLLICPTLVLIFCPTLLICPALECELNQIGGLGKQVSKLLTAIQ